MSHKSIDWAEALTLPAGIGFPGYLPASSGVGPAAAQWRPPVMPASSGGPPASEAGPIMQPFPWLGAPFPGPGIANALAYRPMHLRPVATRVLQLSRISQ